MNYFIVVFDRTPDAKYKPFHDAFVGHRRILKWWHYIKSSYILGTDMTAEELADHFAETAVPNGLPSTHLVIRVTLSDSEGRLVKDAWDWIKKNS
jgi:hypothetical protein